jgi:glycogen synthase
MKVLMFGWEFPPHISGGLGTACFGLTQSLIKEKVNVVFVVPKTSEDQSMTHKFLVNASEVSLPTLKRTKPYATPERRITRMVQQTPGKNVMKMRSPVPDPSLEYIEVSAELKPYGQPGGSSKVKRPTPIMEWNHPLGTDGPMAIQAFHQWWEERAFRDSVDRTDDSFIFTGAYGCNLMQEVQHYSQVAGVIASKQSFDVIHAHDWMTFPAGIVAKRKSKKPLIVHVHSTEFDRSGQNINEAIFEIEKQGMNEADRIITVSNWTKQMVMCRYNIPEEKVKVVHNGIVLKEAQPEFSFPNIASHFVTFLGRITHQKGPGYFVEAAQSVLQEFPQAHFIVAGAGDLLPQIIERVAQLNMSSNFHFTGFLSHAQVEQIWSLTDVYAMPSVSEPFGIAPLEAIQGGVPVILSNQSGVSEVMPHAIKVDFWDVKSLAAAICSVLKYESLSRALRQNGKKHIQHLTWDKAAREVKALYHECTLKK